MDAALMASRIVFVTKESFIHYTLCLLKPVGIFGQSAVFRCKKLNKCCSE